MHGQNKLTWVLFSGTRCRPIDGVQTFLSNECVSVVTDWLHSDRLQLNHDKPSSLGAEQAEASIVFLPQARPQAPFNLLQLIASAVRDLCNRPIYTDSDLSTRYNGTLSPCLSALRRLRSVSETVLLTAVSQSLQDVAVLHWFSTSQPAGLLQQRAGWANIQRLQSVQTAATCTTHFQVPKSNTSTGINNFLQAQAYIMYVTQFTDVRGLFRYNGMNTMHVHCISQC